MALHEEALDGGHLVDAARPRHPIRFVERIAVLVQYLHAAIQDRIAALGRGDELERRFDAELVGQKPRFLLHALVEAVALEELGAGGDLGVGSEGAG